MSTFGAVSRVERACKRKRKRKKMMVKVLSDFRSGKIRMTDVSKIFENKFRIKNK